METNAQSMVQRRLRPFWFGLSLWAMAWTAGSVETHIQSRHFDFSNANQDLTAAWRIREGQWHIEEGVLCVDARGELARMVWSEQSSANVMIEVDLTFQEVDDSQRWVGVTFREATRGASLWSQVPVRFETTADNGTEFAVRKAQQWQVRRRGRSQSNCVLGSPRHLKVLVRGHEVLGLLDDQVVIQSALCLERSSGWVGLAASGCVATFDNLTITALPDIEPVTGSAPRNPCDVFAHRGFSAQAPENTLAACRQAMTLGVEGIEFDVRRTRDRIPVLLHDSTLDRTTNGQGKLCERDHAHLSTLDAGSWKHERYTGEGIPTLDQTLSTLAGCKVRAIIDLKDSDILGPVLTRLSSTRLTDQATIITGDLNVLQQLADPPSNLSTAWLCYDLPGHLLSASQQALWILEQLQQARTRTLDINAELLSPRLIDRLMQEGVTVWTWTVDDVDVARALMSWGVTAITTNRPDAIKKLRQQGLPERPGQDMLPAR